MNAPQHISSIVDGMLKPCPYCYAAPLTPCVSGARPIRYTHAERNRA